MSPRPTYFEPIRQRAADRWEQLENDPELAAPWWQLFKQVQSPRHIVSELLQNADDAGATEAIVRIEEDAFIFEHNGEDFKEEHFASLCRFGYSNKRALHTIGFRGIGFKSTFSLGKRVELYTPTLAIAFEQDRFTEPHWATERHGKAGFTTVRVAIEDKYRKAEVEKNLNEWLKSPVSLLFFKNIRRLQIGSEALHWSSVGPGPIPALGAGPIANTEWLTLNDNTDKAFLIARSGHVPFPEDALAEIKQERMLTVKEHADFPPCAIEIVLGVEGRLYVVLPTGVRTTLPFACNAPFIQDPARLKIKDPETSPTNRWLLERAGRLAAEVMLGWLHNTETPGQSNAGTNINNSKTATGHTWMLERASKLASKVIPVRANKPVAVHAERAHAYGLMPDQDLDDSSLEGTCGTIVEKAFSDVIQNRELLLTEDGDVVAKKECVIIPRPLLDVWPSTQVSTLFDEDKRPALSHEVSDKDRKKLHSWGIIEVIDDTDVFNILRNTHLPKPDNWHGLLKLWNYVAPSITAYRYHGNKGELCIVPVQGKDVLYAANETVRLSEKRLVSTEEDWQFLGDKLSVLNQNWLRYLTEQHRVAELGGDQYLAEEVKAADAVLKAISLDEPSDTSKVIDKVAADFFSNEKITLQDSVRLAHIAAKLGASIGSAFRFVCEDERLRPVDKEIVADANGDLDILLPDTWCQSHLLHLDYHKSFTSCTGEEWLQWISSGRSGLYRFVPFIQLNSKSMHQNGAEKELKRRQYEGGFEPHYKVPWFQIRDWDFEKEIWEHWESLAEEDSAFWGTIVERILDQPPGYWSGAITATMIEVSSNGQTRNLIRDGLTPQWILKLRNKNCLRDTHGVYRKPEELLRRTPETEALLDVEPFIHARLDTPVVAPLLEQFGVGNAPTGPEKLLNRLTALAKAEKTEPHEVEKWYRRLDQLMDDCSTEAYNTIKNAFRQERLILTENETWENTAGVFLRANEEDAPGAETVRISVSNLMLWRRLGIEDRPTAELAINWLHGLPAGSLSQDDARRARSLIARYPVRVWVDCQHWLSLSGAWTPIDEFEYALTMQSLIPWSHLHQWVKDKTANLQDLPIDTILSTPFSGLPLLAAHVEERFHSKTHDTCPYEERGWLKQLGIELQRLKLKDEEETQRIRALARELAVTKWQTTHDLEIISYIDGKPAGTSRHADAFWSERTLHADDKPLPRLARAVAMELGRSFRNADITDAIKLCFERAPEFVSDYMEGNFNLIPREELEPEATEHTPPHDKITQTFDHNDQGEQTTDAELLAGKDDEFTEEKPSEELPVETELEADDTQDYEDDTMIDDMEDIEDTPPKPRKKDKHNKPCIMERFALKQGFRKDYENRFFDEHGNWIGKAKDGLFPWELRASTGEVTKHFWPKDHCLERDPLQLEAEVWSIVDKFPDTYVLVLSDPDGIPIEVTGGNLREMQKRGQLTLHPSTYRLVFEHDDDL